MSGWADLPRKKACVGIPDSLGPGLTRPGPPTNDSREVESVGVHCCVAEQDQPGAGTLTPCRCHRYRCRYRFLDLVMPDSRLGFVLVAKVLPDKAFAALLRVGILCHRGSRVGTARDCVSGHVCFQMLDGDWLQTCTAFVSSSVGNGHLKTELRLVALTTSSRITKSGAAGPPLTSAF